MLLIVMFYAGFQRREKKGQNSFLVLYYFRNCDSMFLIFPCCSISTKPHDSFLESFVYSDLVSCWRKGQKPVKMLKLKRVSNYDFYLDSGFLFYSKSHFAFPVSEREVVSNYLREIQRLFFNLYFFNLLSENIPL